MMTALFWTLFVLFMLVCLILTLLVLIQKGRGGGLSSAFGGGGGNTAFGSKTGDVLTWATSIVFGIFILLAVALNLMANAKHAAPTVYSSPPPSAPSPVAPQSTAEPESIPATAPAERPLTDVPSAVNGSVPIPPEVLSARPTLPTTNSAATRPVKP